MAPSTLDPPVMPFSCFLRMSLFRLLYVRLSRRTPAAGRSPTPASFDASRAFILVGSRDGGRGSRSVLGVHLFFCLFCVCGRGGAFQLVPRAFIDSLTVQINMCNIYIVYECGFCARPFPSKTCSRGRSFSGGFPLFFFSLIYSDLCFSLFVFLSQFSQSPASIPPFLCPSLSSTACVFISSTSLMCVMTTGGSPGYQLMRLSQSTHEWAISFSRDHPTSTPIHASCPWNRALLDQHFRAPQHLSSKKHSRCH